MKKILTLLLIISAYSMPILGMEQIAKEQDFSSVATSPVDQAPHGSLPTDISKHIQSYCQLPLEVDWFFSHGWTFNKDKSIGIFLDKGLLKIYNFTMKKVVYSKNNVDKFTLSPDGQQIFIKFKYTAELIDLKSNQTVLKKQNVDTCRFSPDSQRIFIQFKNGTAKLIDLKLNKTILKKQDILSIFEFSPNGQQIFMQFKGNTSKLIDLKLNQTVLTIPNASYCKFSPDNQQIFIKFWDNTGELIDLKSNKTILKKQNVSNWQFSSDSQWIFIQFYNDDTAELIDLKSNQTALTIPSVSRRKFSPDGQQIFIEFYDKAAVLIDLRSEDLRTVFLTKQNVSYGQFSPDSQWIFVVFWDSTAELIDLRSGAIIKPKQVSERDLIEHMPKINDLTITQALYLQELHDRLLKQKLFPLKQISCNNDEHGTMIYNSFPAHIQLLIDEKINSVHGK